MSITDVNTAPGWTPASYPNQAFTNIVNTHGQFTIIMNPHRRNQWLFYKGHYQYRQKCILKICNFLLWRMIWGFWVVLSTLSKRQRVFPLFKQFLKTESRLHAWWSTQLLLTTLLSSLIARRWVGLQALWRFRLKALSIDEMVGAWCFCCCQAYQGLSVGFLLLQYSILFTVESLSLLYLLFISWFNVLGDYALIS